MAGLVERMTSAGDPAQRSAAQELMQLVMELHGAALERMLATASQAGGEEARLLRQWAADPLVAPLLVLYELHPDDLNTRVHNALERIRPGLRAQGGEAELIDIDGGEIHMRVRLHGCSSASSSIRTSVEEALHAIAPDLTGIVIEWAEEKSASASGLIPVEKLFATKVAITTEVS